MNNKDVIYQIMIDRFVGATTDKQNTNNFCGGNLRGIINNIDYLKNLGITSIYTTPFCKTANYHGYHILDFYEVDPHFGTIDDLNELIELVHRKEMKIIFDFVPNHCWINHPFFVDALNNINSPYRKWFYLSKKNKYKHFLQYKDLPKINLDNKDAAKYMIDVAKYWYNLGFDAFRIDHAVGPSFSFWKYFMHEMRITFQNPIFIGEVWAKGIKRKYFKSIHLKNKLLKYIFGLNQEQLQLNYVGVLDGVMDFEFASLVIENVKKGNKCMGNTTLIKKIEKHFSKYPKDFKLVLFLDNHDTDRFLYYCKGNKEKLIDAIKFMFSFNRPSVLYYGTENLMSNTTTIFDGVPYSDLKVRKVFNAHSSESITNEIRDMLKI